MEKSLKIDLKDIHGNPIGAVYSLRFAGGDVFHAFVSVDSYREKERENNELRAELEQQKALTICNHHEGDFSEGCPFCQVKKQRTRAESAEAKLAEAEKEKEALRLCCEFNERKLRAIDAAMKQTT